MNQERTKANKTDAGNGSKAIRLVSNVLRSPSPDPSRSAAARMITDYHFDKAKIPKTMSFPLKRSRLDAALATSGLSAIRAVSYLLAQSGSIVLRGEYSGELRRGWAAAGTSSITVYAVPSEQRHQVESALETDLLPRLFGWLREIELSGNTRRAADRHFVASWSDGEISVQTF